MGLFSKTPRGEEDDQATGGFVPLSSSGSSQNDRAASGTHEDKMAEAQTSSNVETISPLALKMQEKLRGLDGLRIRVTGLGRTFEQMNALASESQNSIQLLNEFLEGSRTAIETEMRLKAENAKMATELIDRKHRLSTLTVQLEETQAELHSVRKRSTETRTALENARNDLIAIRDNNKKVNEEYRAQSARLVEANAQIQDLSGELNDLKARHASLEEHAESLKNQVETIALREKELQQNLSESASLLEEEIRKNNISTTELEAVKRENVDFRNDNIDLKSHLDVANQELGYSKNRLEEEKRKHDNEVFALNAEIENLSSQRRIGAQSLQELSRENNAIKERNRDLLKRMQEIEHLLDSAQKNHDKDRNELVSTNAKLRELNLRYNSVLTDLNHERTQNQRFAESLEELVTENKTLRKYRIQYDAANEQIAQLKGVIADYQAAMGHDSLLDELTDPLSSGIHTASSSSPEKLGTIGAEHSDESGKSHGNKDDRVVKLRE